MIAAAGIMAGAASQAAFCIAYAWIARRAAWPLALTAGCVAFALATAALTPVAPPLSALALAVFVALAVAVRTMPRPSKDAGVRTPPPVWDVPARMAVATAFVIVLTASAGALGPRLTGLLAPFPLYAAVLTVFAHAFDGGGAAASVLRGLLMGLFAFAAFFLVLAAMLSTAGIAAAFTTALAVALALQGASLWLLHRL